jgi:hypothetical protein
VPAPAAAFDDILRDSTAALGESTQFGWVERHTAPPSLSNSNSNLLPLEQPSGPADDEEVSFLGDAESSLGDAESSLGDAESSLGDAESSLGDAKSSLGDAESSLGDAKSSLGDAKSSLGDAESSLGDAKSSLRGPTAAPALEDNGRQGDAACAARKTQRDEGGGGARFVSTK